MIQKQKILYFFCVFKPFSARQDEKIIRSRRDKSLVKMRQKFCQDEMKGIFANKLKKKTPSNCNYSRSYNNQLLLITGSYPAFLNDNPFNIERKFFPGRKRMRLLTMFVDETSVAVSFPSELMPT